MDWEGQQAYAYWLECVWGLGRKSRWELVKAAGSPKKQDKSVNGQISMFDLLGV